MLTPTAASNRATHTQVFILQTVKVEKVRNGLGTLTVGRHL
jgi:hypothetical protein